MGLDLWFQEDVRRVLECVRDTAEVTHLRQMGDVEEQAFQEGFCAALRLVAVGFGLRGFEAGGQTLVFVRRAERKALGDG